MHKIHAHTRTIFLGLLFYENPNPFQLLVFNLTLNVYTCTQYTDYIYILLYTKYLRLSIDKFELN